MKSTSMVSEEESGVRIKVEPGAPSTMSHSGIFSKFTTVSVKKELSGRLASFKPPRDLSLTGNSSHKALPGTSNFNNQGAARKTFTPNVNVIRRKGQVPSPTTHASTNSESKPGTEKTRRPRNKPNFIQTSGVFSAGLAPGRPKEYRGSEKQTVQLERPRLNLNRTVSKKHEDSKMKDLLKDDFIDDPNILPDLNDCPKSLPLLINAIPHSNRDLDDTFHSLQIKTEKHTKIKAEELNARAPELCRLFSEVGPSKLVVLDFPDEVSVVEDRKFTKESKSEQANKVDLNSRQHSTNRLANLSEGRWGTLRILENGAAYILAGNDRIPVMMTRHCPRQTVMSVTVDAAKSRGELVNLGNVSATLRCYSDLSPETLARHK